MKKHYLICGGAGFIGVNLCHRLVKLGHNVTVVDNLYCGNNNNLPKEVRFINMDIRNIVLSTTDIYDGIFNLACPASPKVYQKDPIFTIDTCVQGMAKLLDIARSHDIPILQASTSEVYGAATETPQKEEYRGNVSCTGIRACYDEGKRMTEALCFDHHRTYGTKIRVVRIFNTYGPYMAENDGRVISNFVTQALKGEQLTVYGDGTQTRSFCFVDDLVEGLIKAIESEHIGPINLGNPDERRILEIAEIINKFTRNKAGFKLESLPSDDPPQRCPDISRAKDLLGWEPKHTLIDGLSKTIFYYKHRLVKVGIVGGGFVGSATSGFACNNVTVKIYDIDVKKCKPEGVRLEDLMDMDVIFICVPTPMRKHDKSCDTYNVEACVRAIQAFPSHPSIVVRSTVPPGTCERLGVAFMPEFLCNSTWGEDFKNTPVWYIGSENEDVIRLITTLIHSAYEGKAISSNIIKSTPTKDLEMINYTRNSFLATKIAFCNEIRDLCEKIGVNWETVRSGFDTDLHIGLSQTPVPGPDNERRFDDYCLLKDTNALYRIFTDNKVPTAVIFGALVTNDAMVRGEYEI